MSKNAFIPSSPSAAASRPSSFLCTGPSPAPILSSNQYQGQRMTALRLSAIISDAMALIEEDDFLDDEDL